MSRKVLLLAAVAAFAVGCGPFLQRPLRVVTALVSHNVCSEVFVTGMDPQVAYDQSVAPRPAMGLINWAVRFHADRQRGDVTSSLGGYLESRAVLRPGLGCLVAQPDAPEIALSPATPTAVELPEIAAAELVEPTNARLRAALGRAFAEPQDGPQRWTRAVVVVHDGQVVAERYAPGIGVETPLLGYSATKSVISALVGILVRQGKLVVDAPAPVPAWSDTTDPRHGITTDHLLRMISGLSLAESGTPWSPVARMLYEQRDMAGFAATADLQATPGTRWAYTSGGTLILSGMIRDALGGDTERVLQFARHELFEPLGMHSVVLEFDATGTPVGSTYMLASARDWARFGLLYLNDGVVAGRQLLPQGWVRYSTTPTLDTGYGAGWWTNRVAGHIPWSSVVWGIPGAPPDTFFARGLLGQYVAVVPSRRLVVTRFGASHGPDGDIEGLGQLIGEVTAALESE